MFKDQLKTTWRLVVDANKELIKEARAQGAPVYILRPN
jgi:hypothetical protein